MRLVTIALVYHLANIRDYVASSIITNQNVTNIVKGTRKVEAKQFAKRIPQLQHLQRTTDDPKYEAMNDPYVSQILANHDGRRRAHTLRKHKQKMMDNIAEVRLKASRVRKTQLNMLKLYNNQVFQAMVSDRKAEETKRLHKNRHKMMESVRAANKAKQIYLNKTVNNFNNLSRYKTQGLRRRKSDFRGKKDYIPYKEKFSFIEVLGNLF